MGSKGAELLALVGHHWIVVLSSQLT